MAQENMDEQENKKKVPLSCIQQGPGPIYNLPSLIGYAGHDPSRRREPAYTMKFLKTKSRRHEGPGPKYDVVGFTNRGPIKSPAYSIGLKRSGRTTYTGPSPMDYETEKCPLVNHNRKSPAYSFRFRDAKQVKSEGPGPIYLLPTCIGPNVIDKKAVGAFSIGVPTKKERWDNIPGPGAYQTDNYDVIKRRVPAYSLILRPRYEKWSENPGPKYKSDFNMGRKSPMYTFGFKHSQCAGTPMTEADFE